MDATSASDRPTNSAPPANSERSGGEVPAKFASLGLTYDDVLLLPGYSDLAPTDTRAVSDWIFSTYLVPFEVFSLFLLAALIGAIVIDRWD